MKRANGLWIGIILILIGFLYAGSALDIFEFTVFFPGWWTLFIIVPCVYGLFRKGEEKTGYIIGLVIGLSFLINEQNTLFHIDFWPMMIAVVCILIGVKLIFPQKEKEKPDVDMSYGTESGSVKSEIDGTTFERTSSRSGGSYVNSSAILGGKDIRIDNEMFTGADLTAILGGIELNLKNAVITEDVYVNVTALFGGIDILVPANVRVIADDCNAVLGGVDVKRSYANHLDMDAPRMIIRGNCIFGGLDVR